jgi:hypothetical protein
MGRGEPVVQPATARELQSFCGGRFSLVVQAPQRRECVSRRVAVLTAAVGMAVMVLTFAAIMRAWVCLLPS